MILHRKTDAWQDGFRVGTEKATFRAAFYRSLFLAKGTDPVATIGLCFGQGVCPPGHPRSFSVFVHAGDAAVFDAEECAAAQVFYHFFVQLGRCDEKLHIVYLAHEEPLPVEIEL